MRHEVLLALIAKVLEERLSKISLEPGPQGPRGFRGPQGIEGRSFSMEEHGEELRKIVYESRLKFSDLTEDEINSLIGPKGDQGPQGERGPRGFDGESFVFEEYKEEIDGLVRDYIDSIKSEFKLTFKDLSPEDKEKLRGERGPRGQRGSPGRDFDFEEHREFFESLRPEINIEDLKLRFKDLSPEEVNSLKLKFSDLTADEINSLRGPRGQKGKRGETGERGPQGEKGEPGLDGPAGPRGRKGDEGPKGERGDIGPRGPIGPIGLQGPRGLDGSDGKDGADGEDAPRVVDVQVVKDFSSIKFVFYFEDGSTITTNKVKVDSTQQVVSIVPIPGQTSGTATQATNLKIQKLATTDIVAGRAVKADSDTHVSHATNDGTLAEATVMGVAENSVIAGGVVTVLLLGTLVDASFNTFVVNDLLHLGTDGEIIVTPSGHNYLTPVGTALGTNTILASIGRPIGVL